MNSSDSGCDRFNDVAAISAILSRVVTVVEVQALFDHCRGIINLSKK